MPTPSPSPPISLSPPSAGERLARCTAPPALSSPPPVPSPLLPLSGCLTQIQTLRMASTQALIDAVTATLPSPPLPPSLYIPPLVDHRNDLPESEQPPHKRLCLSTLGSKYEARESSIARPIRGPAEAVHEIALHDRGERVAMDYNGVDLLMGARMTLQDRQLWIVVEEAYAFGNEWLGPQLIGLHIRHIQLQSTLILDINTRYLRLVSNASRLRWQVLCEDRHRRQARDARDLRVMRDMR
ncbi:hypothetical protein Tco_1506342 [Tanacetum coccineum]